MKTQRLICAAMLISAYAAITFVDFGNIYGQAVTGGSDYYRIKSAVLAQKRAFDLRLTPSYATTSYPFRVALSERDTATFRGSSLLADVVWSVRYGYNSNVEFNLSGITFYDKLTNTYRYGAGDTRLGVRYSSPNVVGADMNWSAETYYSFPTSFNTSERLARTFSSSKASFGAAGYVDFNWDNWTAKVNAGYYHAGGRAKTIDDPNNTFWYQSLNGIYGIDPLSRSIQSSQFCVGFGIARNSFFNTILFGEYYSQNVLAVSGGGVSLGNIAAGLKAYQRSGTEIKVGVDMPSGKIRPDMGFFLDVRMNSIIGRRRLLQPQPRMRPEEEPALTPGRKPFISREGVLYSLPKKPIKDTIFIIDGTPSMLGRGIGEGKRGEAILNRVIEFAQTLVDSIPDKSNVTLITFTDEVTTLSWQAIDASKKEEIKNSIRDIPDEMNIKVDELENLTQRNGWREKLETALEEAYKQLETFKMSDYNRQHLQRIVLFSDGIDESTLPHNLSAGFETIHRQYQINRDDFRYFYYIHTNPKTEGIRLDENIILFAEREDGKLKRSVDLNNVDVTEQLISEINYNNMGESNTLQYLSQISKIAVLEFNTQNLGSIRDPLVKAFRSVFDYNEYFQLTPQEEIRAVMSSEGVQYNQKVVLTEMVKLGRRLGVDYIVYGEVTKYRIERGKGLYVPYVFGMPNTVMEMEVAVQLVNVADGTLAFVNNIGATASKSEGIQLIPRHRENKLNQLSGLEMDQLQKSLMVNWSKKLRDSMFQDLTIRIE